MLDHYEEAVFGTEGESQFIILEENSGFKNLRKGPAKFQYAPKLGDVSIKSVF